MHARSDALSGTPAWGAAPHGNAADLYRRVLAHDRLHKFIEDVLWQAPVGKSEPSPGADVGRGEPSPAAAPGADVGARSDQQRSHVY
jgi:hypothetical protein